MAALTGLLAGFAVTFNVNRDAEFHFDAAVREPGAGDNL
jgi:hypothetical protein